MSEELEAAAPDITETIKPAESAKLIKIWTEDAIEQNIQEDGRSAMSSVTVPKIEKQDAKVVKAKNDFLKSISSGLKKLFKAIEGIFDGGGVGTPGGDSALKKTISDFSSPVGKLFESGGITSSLGDIIGKGLDSLGIGEQPDIPTIEVDPVTNEAVVRSKQSAQGEKKPEEEKKSTSNLPKGLQEIAEAAEKLADAFGGDAADIVSKAKELAGGLSGGGGGGGSSGAPSASGVEVGSAFRATLDTTPIAIDGVIVEAATVKDLTRVIKVPVTTIGEEFPDITSETGLITERANYSASGIFDRPNTVKELFLDVRTNPMDHLSNKITLGEIPIKIIEVKGYVEGYKYGKIPVTIVSKQEWGDTDDSYGDGYYEFDKKEMTIHGSYIPRADTLKPDGRAHPKNGVVFEVIYIYLEKFDPGVKQTFNKVATLVKEEPELFETITTMPKDFVEAQADESKEVEWIHHHEETVVTLYKKLPSQRRDQSKSSDTNGGNGGDD